MKRLGVLIGSLAFAQLGCEPLFDYGGKDDRVTPPAEASALAPVPPVVPVPPPVASVQAVVPVPAASASAEAPGEPSVILSSGAIRSGLSLNQLRVVPAPTAYAPPLVLPSKDKPKTPVWHEITLYGVFRSEFARRVELRAEDADHQELGRTEREAALHQPADSARFVTFRLDPRVPLERVKAFVAYVDPSPEPEAEEPPKAAPVAAKPPKTTSPPAPPEPEYLGPKQSGLVPKDP